MSKPPSQKTHGETRPKPTREYIVWARAKSRCHSPADAGYRYYGARGIYMCERWRESYPAFLADMGRRPDGQTLERIDNDGPYSPENCRWASWLDQHNNTRTSRHLAFNGERHTVAEWGRRIGVSSQTIRARIDVCKWSIEKALTTPSHR